METTKQITKINLSDNQIEDLKDLINSIYPNSLIYIRQGEVIINRKKTYYDYYDCLTVLRIEKDLKEKLKRKFNQNNISITTL